MSTISPVQAEPSAIDGRERLYLMSLAGQYPSETAAAAEIAYLEALLTLPKGSVHVLSDIHGEAKKLQHVIHNASGSLRPTVEQLFADQLKPEEVKDLLTMIYYPAEAFGQARQKYSALEDLQAFFRRTVWLEFEVMREVAQRSTVRRIERTFPDDFRDLFRELFFEREGALGRGYMEAMLDSLVRLDRGLDLLRHISTAIRNLSVFELIVAGDCGDRGPRIDRVIDCVMCQPNVAITWGNHDMTWMGASLGHPLLIATVLRISLRYRRLSQLEEGYGIIMSPLEKLARTSYAGDPAERFMPKGEGLRETITMARMQKAIAVIEFKLEGQAIRRNPQFEMEHRNLLPGIDFEKGTIRLDGSDYPLLDRHFPTVDPADPCALSPEESACMERIRESFLSSDKLARQMRYLNKRGSMYLIRDGNLIFHGCLAVDEQGNDLPMKLDGRDYVGKALLEKLQSLIHRCFRESRQEDLDLLWYLWAGAPSPLFGKDKMATLERYLIADKATHKETKNPYFKLIHEVDFCEKILREFGVDTAEGMIVNGHVPVKIQEGEDPVKRSGKAITIDGAFSEAYGDYGYTLILDSQGLYLARHSHFESVAEAVARGTDIIPGVTRIKTFGQEHRVGDTEQGDLIGYRIEMLRKLIYAFRENLLAEAGAQACSVEED